VRPLQNSSNRHTGEGRYPGNLTWTDKTRI